MRLDLGSIQRLIAGNYLDDVVKVERGWNNRLEGELDEDHNLVPVPTRTLWEGDAAILPATTASGTPAPRVFEGPPHARTDANYYALLPVDAPVFQVDDILTVTGTNLTDRDGDPAPRDPHIMGRSFRVREVPDASTFLVVRTVFLKLL